MYFLATIADTIRVPPPMFIQGDSLSLQNAINSKYPERVIMDVGLIICLYDVVNVGAALIHAADGGTHFEIVFRVVVFKPFVGEVIVGRVREATKEGLGVTLDFFDNVKIPYYNIFEPNHYDTTRSSWVWDDHQNDGEEAEEPDPDALLELKVGDDIRFVVDRIDFTDTNYSVKGVQQTVSSIEKVPPRVLSNVKIEGGSASALALADTVRKRSTSFDNTSSAGGGIGETLNGAINGRGGEGASDKNKCFMTITGSVKDDGLGKGEWWEQGEEEEEEGEGEEEQGEEE